LRRAPQAYAWVGGVGCLIRTTPPLTPLKGGILKQFCPQTPFGDLGVYYYVSFGERIIIYKNTPLKKWCVLNFTNDPRYDYNKL